MPTENGFVPTPPPVAELLVMMTFVDRPSEGDTLLYPGAGTGNILAAVRRYCSVRDHPMPEVVAYEPINERFQQLANRFTEPEQPAVPPVSEAATEYLKPTYPPSAEAHDREIAHGLDLRNEDYLRNPPDETFDYVIGNPPYLRYKAVETKDREFYADRYAAAEGQFDLYMPFIERMIVDTADDGWMGFISPRNFLFSNHASAFRDRLRREEVHETCYLPEPVFEDRTIRTAITLVSPDDSFGQSGAFCIDPHGREMARLLTRFGFSESKIGSQLDSYLETCKEDTRRLAARRRREQQDGGYNPKVDPYCDPDGQESLEAYL